MSEKLDLFINSQAAFNERMLDTTEKLTQTIIKIEKHQIELAQVSKRIDKNELKIEKITEEQAEIKSLLDFVSGAKWLFRALILALMLTASGLVWQLIIKEKEISKNDVSLIIKAIMSDKKAIVDGVN